jgi:hypothetical protein
MSGNDTLLVFSVDRLLCPKMIKTGKSLAAMAYGSFSYNATGDHELLALKYHNELYLMYKKVKIKKCH